MPGRPRTFPFVPLALLLLLGLTPAAAQTGDLEREVDRALKRAGLREPRLGLAVAEADSGTVLLERDAGRPLLLASNSKLFPTACALALLGPGYRFRTTVAWDPDTDALHVYGAGDPLLSGRLYDDDPDRILREAAVRLKALGRDRFAGGLVLHPGIFDAVDRPAGWVEAGYETDRWWCAPVSGLSFNDNCIDIEYAAGESVGRPARLVVRPATAFVEIVNRTKTVAGNPRPIHFQRRGRTITATGEVKLGVTSGATNIALEEPVLFFGQVFREALEREGFSVGPSVRIEPGLERPPRALEMVLAEHTLGDAVRACNTSSQNLHAEMIVKLLGFRFRGEGSTEMGLEVIGDFLREEVGVTGVELRDGSGLSRGNRAPASAVLRLLTYMRRHRHGASFIESLAASGRTGTMRNRLKEVEGRVRAKTGHIRGVSTLSGYVEGEDGKPYAFSILVNGWKAGSADRFQDYFCASLARRRGP